MRDEVSATAIVENSIIRARCRRGANLNSIYRRISRLAAEIRSTRSRNEGLRLAVDHEQWIDAASIIRRLHRNFAECRVANSRERERVCIEKHLANISRVCHSSRINGKRAWEERRAKSVWKTFPELTSGINRRRRLCGKCGESDGCSFIHGTVCWLLNSLSSCALPCN